MRAYLKAYEAYHGDGEPWIPWTVALDFHLQHGVVISDGGTFLMARRVVMGWRDYDHLTLRAVKEDEAADGWHVWSAAGELGVLLEMAGMHGAEGVTFQRRNERLHRTVVGRLGRGDRRHDGGMKA